LDHAETVKHVWKIAWRFCRIPVLPFDAIVRPLQETVMPQYLVAIYRPDDYDPSVETEAAIEEIHTLNRKMISADARKFACGLSPAGNARSLRKQPDGKVLVTDGPYTESTEHIGGFWELEAADLDGAIA
jgi:hypothetical protein